MKRIILPACFLILTLQVFAQEKPQAIKFDEYNEKGSVNLKLLEAKARQFVEKLKEKNQKSQGFVFIYHSLPKPSCNQFLTAKNYFAPRDEILRREFGSQKRNIVLDAGGFREFFAIEFWVIPKNAERPSATPDYQSVHLGVCCPSIKIDSESTNKNKIMVLTAELSGGNSSEEKPLFQWNISAGKIIGGQRTKQIKVDVSKINAKEITVTVELEKGVDDMCQRSVSSNVNIQTAKLN